MFFMPEIEARYTSEQLLALPNSYLKSRKNGEYSSACIVCGGEDRFQFWPSVGNYFCRQCGLRGFVGDAPAIKDKTLAKIINDKLTSITPEVVTWRQYHYDLLINELALNYWYRELGPEADRAIDHFGLGFCADYKGLGPSVTIPISYSDKVYVIKHRLLAPPKEKYITEPSGRGAMLLNLDEALISPRVIITEGEKKAIRLWLEGYVAVSPTNGADGFQDNWAIFFLGKEVYVIFDPDSNGQKNAKRVADLLGGKVIDLPDKVDTWINSGGNIKEILGEW